MKSLRTSLVGLSLLAALSACHAPTAPPNTPTATLSLLLPDSAHVFDTVTFRAHYSDPVQPSWKFEWQFGDSSNTTTKDSSSAHIYDSAGTYTVLVTLADSTTKTIAKQSRQLHVMPLNGPILTLTVPDTNYWGDSCVMSIASSQPLKPGWKFSWQLGDGNNVSGVDTILHYYLNPGTYYVIVNLDDTVHDDVLASRIAAVHVVARHFDLALLQSMKYVDVTWWADASTVMSGTQSICGEPLPTQPLPNQMMSWSGLGFGGIYKDGYARWDSSHDNLLDSSSIVNSDTGEIDLSLTLLTNLSENSSYFGFYQGPPSFCRYTVGYSFSTENVPFHSASDSDVVFEAKGPLCYRSAFSAFENTNSLWGSGSFSDRETADFFNLTVAPFVIIRFHK